MASPKEISNPEYSENKLERGGIWVANRDIKVVTHGRDTTFWYPGPNLATVDISEFENHVPKDLLDKLEICTRSRLAQFGIEIPADEREKIINSLKTGNKDCLALSIYNHSERGFEINNGLGLGRLLALNGRGLEGEDLIRLIRGNKIKIGGRENRDWWRVVDESQNMIGIGMALNMSRDKRLSLPNDEELISINGKIVSPREQADSLLESLREVKKTAWIGETEAPLTLGEGLYGVVSSKVGRREGQQIKIYHESRHLNSVLLRGNGDTDWPIRTEIVGPTSPSRIANFIIINFYKSD